MYALSMNVHPFAKFYKMKVYFRMLYIVLHVLVLLQFISIVKYYYHTVGDSFLGTYLTDIILIWYNYKWIGSALRPSFVDQDINAVSGFWLMCGR